MSSALKVKGYEPCQPAISRYWIIPKIKKSSMNQKCKKRIGFCVLSNIGKEPSQIKPLIKKFIRVLLFVIILTWQIYYKQNYIKHQLNHCWNERVGEELIPQITGTAGIFQCCDNPIFLLKDFILIFLIVYSYLQWRQMIIWHEWRMCSIVDMINSKQRKEWS